MRGLKLRFSNNPEKSLEVAPFAGAWIEITTGNFVARGDDVAPFAGAWIEINGQSRSDISSGRRTLRGCVD